MKKDLASKKMTKCKDVFSDICNVNLLSQTKKNDNDVLAIHPEELELIPTDIVYHNKLSELQEHRMDVRMKHTVSNTTIALFCLENQAGVSNIMPVRSMGYLYSSYSEQIRQIKEHNEQNGSSYYTKEIGDNQKLIPVICLILYYGTEEWTAPKTLKEMMNIPDEWKTILKPWVANHRIHIISLADQDEETRKKYQSDFRHIADYLVYTKQKDKEQLKNFFTDTTRKIVHPQEFLDMMHSFTHDMRYLKMAERIRQTKSEGDEVTMCMLLDMAEERGEERGMEQGVGQGINRINLLNIRLAEDGRTEDILAAAKDLKLQRELMDLYGI